MRRITAADIAQMRKRGYDRSTVAEAEAWLVKCRRADELITLIRRAFAGVELKDGTGLAESAGIDDYAGPEELKRLRAADEKVDWQKIPAQRLNDCHAAPSFLDARGMLFHTPAFIVSELNGDFQHDFIDRLITGYYSAKEFPGLLTESQCEAIVECLRFYGNIELYNYDSRQIDSAINRFCKSR